MFTSAIPMMKRKKRLSQYHSRDVGEAVVLGILPVLDYIGSILVCFNLFSSEYNSYGDGSPANHSTPSLLPTSMMPVTITSKKKEDMPGKAYKPTAENYARDDRGS
jgi:hypothetical protein